MSRPKTKTDLINQNKNNYQRLFDLVRSYSMEDQLKDFPKGTMNRNIRDVLAHLHHWHLMMMDWYIVGMNGTKPFMPAEGYTWKTTPNLNKKIHSIYSQIDLAETKQIFTKSYKTLMKIIENHSNEELFTKKKYHWTGSTSLGSYLISATCSHYNWAYKLIKKAKKQTI